MPEQGEFVRLLERLKPPIMRGDDPVLDKKIYRPIYYVTFTEFVILLVLHLFGQNFLNYVFYKSKFLGDLRDVICGSRGGCYRVDGNLFTANILMSAMFLCLFVGYVFFVFTQLQIRKYNKLNIFYCIFIIIYSFFTIYFIFYYGEGSTSLKYAKYFNTILINYILLGLMSGFLEFSVPLIALFFRENGSDRSI